MKYKLTLVIGRDRKTLDVIDCAYVFTRVDDNAIDVRWEGYILGKWSPCTDRVKPEAARFTWNRCIEAGFKGPVTKCPF